jgi:hypothetical protein
MLKNIFPVLLGACFILSGSIAFGSTTGAPGTPNSPPDPCQNCQMPPPAKLCKKVYTQECVEYQGTPPRCKRYESVPHEVCS